MISAGYMVSAGYVLSFKFTVVGMCYSKCWVCATVSAGYVLSSKFRVPSSKCRVQGLANLSAGAGAAAVLLHYKGTL